MSDAARQLFVEEAGGKGETLIFVHGLGGTVNTWYPQTQILKRDRQLICYDLAGSGRSSLEERISIESHVEDLERIIEQSGAKTVHLAGHSMGTIVCQHLAVKSPERVASMMLVGAFGEPPEAARDAIRQRAEKVRSGGMRAIADAIAAAGTSSDSKVNHPAAVAFVRESLMAQNPEGYARNCEALADARAADLSRVGCPVLLITGEEDRSAPVAVARSLDSALVDSELQLLPGCGHWATVERPKQVNYLMSLFTARQRRKSA
ncbi:MAG TPA: alpha/beta hydrolase [Bryobacteraceae bacterium]|jgi:pimeloyl-ACP methyl ester carboxylesterase|nr:alpha/beta hydrolase [Bryobacteraceae bacterium]